MKKRSVTIIALSLGIRIEDGGKYDLSSNENEIKTSVVLGKNNMKYITVCSILK